MPKLNQIIAVVSGKKTEAQRKTTEIYRKCSSGESFVGLKRVYTPKDDDGEKLPNEGKPVQLTVNQVVQEFRDSLSDLFDVVATQEYANTTAVANIVVGDVVVAEKVPVSYLLFLEKQLQDINTFINKLPTLDNGEEWSLDSNTGNYISKVSHTNKSKKIPQSKVLYDATEHHPAQIEKWNEDVSVGTWATTKYSGAISEIEKRDLVERVRKLSEAVKFAREEANSIEAKNINVSNKVFDYLFK